MRRALRPVLWRIRLRHGLTGLCWGLLAMLALAMAVMALSFMMPLKGRNTALLACAAALPLGAAIGLFWPVSAMQAARKADACGLQERAQTALTLAGRQDEMARLQRSDALRALENLDVRKALPMRLALKPLMAAGGCAAVALALFFLPNPQDAVLRQQAQFQQKMEKPAEAIEKAADQLDEAVWGEKTAQELRRLLGDLAREVRESGDSREALKALSQGQQRLEKQLSESRAAAMEALGAAGLDSLAQAMEAGGQSLEDALEGQDVQSLAEQMNAAAQAASADTAASAALQAAANALSQGSASQAAQALGQLSAAGLSQGQVAAALQSAKAMAGGQGQGKGQGQGQGQGNGSSGSGQGQGAGSGAGQGSTNQDMSGSGGQSGGKSGAGPAGGYKLGEYEAIYDPTRLGDGGEITQSTGQVDENAQVSELTLGPGLGDASGSVPYDQVVGQYQSAAVQRAQEAALPGYAQQWVADYFSALTE